MFAALTLLATFPTLPSPPTAVIPRPEHPRPDRERREWLNLNGTWEFAETDDDPDEHYLSGKPYPDRITVPFCRESSLSGLGRKGFVKNVWYRRTFRRPDDWKSDRTLFHIGACDWKTAVWVNGHAAGDHVGGSSPIDLDITDLMRPGDNTVVIHAFDDTRSGLQALGKQCDQLESYGCLYTRTTGIWQTVWLEGVGKTYLEDLQIDADVQGSRLVVTPRVAGEGGYWTLSARVRGPNSEIVTLPKDWDGRELSIHLEDPRWWSTADPFLYDIELQLRDEHGVLDTVKTYAGFRTVSIDDLAILINGKPEFQRLVLDQGFYPDGIWTAPSDAALKRDIELSMAVGFNGARLHQKVFEPRFLYWADKLGYLVWGEFPNWGLNYRDARVYEPVVSEWQQLVGRDRNHPSLIGWCPFNETPAEAGDLQNIVVALTREIDPSRPVIDTSGYIHSVADPQVMDAHDYDQNPETFKARWDLPARNAGLPQRYGGTTLGKVPFMLSEYGGIGWNTETGWGYGDAPKTLDEFYARFKGLTDALLDNPAMFGFCYTQLTDVEQERNGIYTYQREPKFDAATLRSILSRQAAIEAGVKLPSGPDLDFRVAVGSARDPEQAKPWRFAVSKPAANWFEPGFDDAAWGLSMGAFGDKGGFERDIARQWSGKDLWLRQAFSYDSSPFTQAMLAIHYDNATQVFVNGKQVWASRDGAWNDGYEGFDVTEPLRAALVAGDNLIAVHCHQDDGGQFIDLALLLGTPR